jgi:type II secretory pathway pseudopilin PulG
MELHQLVISNKKGLTLVEVMLALIIAMVVFLALMQTALVSIDANMKNTLRNEAVNIAERRINEAKGISFDSLAPDTGSLSTCDCPSASSFSYTVGKCVSVELSKMTNVNFCTNRDVNTLNSDNKQVVITVGWTWKDEEFTHRVSTILRRQ